MSENTTTQEHRQAVTRLTSGTDDHVTVIIRLDDGTEEKRDLVVHEFARLIPLISLGDLDRLYDDIKDQGVLEPLVTYQGQILDGRNRLAIAAVLGVPVQLTEFTGDDAEARAFVWSKNAARRHMTLPQLALSAERFGFVAQAKREAGPDAPARDGSGRFGAAPWARIAAKKVGNITARTLERFQEARIPEAPDTQRRIDAGEIRRVDVAVKEAVAERSVITGRVIDVPPVVPRTPWDRLGCARGDVLAAERAILNGERGTMTRTQFANRAREIQAALIRIQTLYRYGEPQ